MSRRRHVHPGRLAAFLLAGGADEQDVRTVVVMLRLLKRERVRTIKRAQNPRLLPAGRNPVSRYVVRFGVRLSARMLLLMARLVYGRRIQID